MSEMGRPKIEIDYRQLEALCAVQCTLADIASVFNCSEDTIERRCKEHYKDEDGEPMTFAEVLKKYSAEGKASLRKKQYNIAMQGNVSMLIWLGKQLLGQKDRSDVTSGDKPVNGPTVYIPDNGRDSTD